MAIEQAEIAAEPREAKGKGPNRRLRAGGRVPAVIYGHGSASRMLTIEKRAMERALATGHHLVKVREGDEVRQTLIREVQVQPVTQEILHVDFVEVRADDLISITVPVAFKGEAAGLKEGGVVDYAMRELSILCRAGSPVDSVTVDVSGLALGAAVHVSELALPEGARPQPGTEHLAVAVCRRPRGTEEEAAQAEGAVEGAAVEGAAAEGPAEPEVIAEKKREERAREKESREAEKGR
jgi:large subunit ribosomal protein L25